MALAEEYWKVKLSTISLSLKNYCNVILMMIRLPDRIHIYASRIAVSPLVPVWESVFDRCERHAESTESRASSGDNLKII